MKALKVVLYALAVLTSLSCTVLLFRGYVRKKVRLLMWSGICFAALTISNLALFADLVIFTERDLRLARLIPALIGMLCLLYAFIWDAE